VSIDESTDLHPSDERASKLTDLLPRESLQTNLAGYSINASRSASKKRRNRFSPQFSFLVFPQAACSAVTDFTSSAVR
jgi:hypothetical protein